MSFDESDIVSRSDDTPLGYSAAERQLANTLFTEHYTALMEIARRKRRRSNRDLTLSTTDILHESFIKLRHNDAWASEQHFLRSAVLAMRHVLCDYARRKLTAKRQAVATVPIDEIESVLPEYSETPEQLIGIAELMGKLVEHEPRWAQVVDARYFSGMTEEETAELLGVSVRTVRRDWKGARAWLAAELKL